MAVFQDYAPRRFRRMGLWTLGDFRCKAYAILADGQVMPDAACQAAARDYLAADLPAAAVREGDAFPLGFAMLHAGATALFLLGDWWAHDDVICQRTAIASGPGAPFVSADDRPLLACLWEMVVLSHERDAFVRHLAKADPDIDAYLTDWLPDAEY